MIENLVTHTEKSSFTSEICCICLEQIQIFNKPTNCCKNYIHKSCILTWIIYNCKIECCLCRSDKIEVLVEDIISYDINNIKEYNINKDTFINNLNQIINELNGNDSIIIQINEVNDNASILTIHSTTFLHRRKFKDLLTLILIPIFYLILFYILPYQKNNDYIDN